ncbi:hypothetical protein [Floricoccus penangensis]|nr:hypothetical protein [Floricoccus penangensis]
MELQISNGTLHVLYSKNDEKIQGWLMFRTKNNEEFLIQQNWYYLSFCSLPIKRKVYKSTIPLNFLANNKSYKELKKNNKGYLGLMMGLILSKFIPQYLIFSPKDSHFSIMKGLANLIYFWGIIVLILSIVFYFRKTKLKKIINNRNGELHFYGKARSSTPIRNVKNIMKVW